MPLGFVSRISRSRTRSVTRSTPPGWSEWTAKGERGLGRTLVPSDRFGDFMAMPGSSRAGSNAGRAAEGTGSGIRENSGVFCVAGGPIAEHRAQADYVIALPMFDPRIGDLLNLYDTNVHRNGQVVGQAGGVLICGVRRGGSRLRTSGRDRPRRARQFRQIRTRPSIFRKRARRGPRRTVAPTSNKHRYKNQDSGHVPNSHAPNRGSRRDQAPRVGARTELGNLPTGLDPSAVRRHHGDTEQRVVRTEV
jgi:hypothetical protein